MKPTLLVLAAGMGSRYGGVKQIDSVGLHNETLLDFATYDAMRSSFGKVVYIIRKDIEKDFRERLFDRVARNCDAEYVFQTPEFGLTSQQLQQAATRSKPWGTIHAVLCAQEAIHEPFAVINADDYYGRSAFETLGTHLSALPVDGIDHAMVGFVLGNTTFPFRLVSGKVINRCWGIIIAQNGTIECVRRICLRCSFPRRL